MTQLESDARAIADLAAGTILARVEIAAPPERVFRALTSADEIPRWWGQEGVYRTTKWTTDLRVGGRWRADGVGADGKAFFVEGEFLEIDAPHKLVHTWRPEWDEGVTTVTYEIEAIAGGARVTVKHTGFGERRDSCAGHAFGWEQVLGWLRGFSQPELPSQYFFLKLVPPRPTFALDMNDDERALMQRHVAYWTEKLREGSAIVFGPVGDPTGPWGLGVVRVPDEAGARAFEAGDPAIAAGRGFRYEILPMPTAVHR
jgi:uncharacterized protein YndB with AHSA1/START domain